MISTEFKLISTEFRLISKNSCLGSLAGIMYFVLEICLCNSPMLLSSVHQQVLQVAELGGLGDADNAAAVEVLRRLAGLPPVSTRST